MNSLMLKALDESGVHWELCEPCGVELGTKQEYLLHIITVKHKTNVDSGLTNEDKMRQLAKRREDIETKLSEEAAKKQRLEKELESIDTEIDKL